MILFVQSYQGLAVLQLLSTAGTLVLPQGGRGGGGGGNGGEGGLHLPLPLALDTFLTQTILPGERHPLARREWILAPEIINCSYDININNNIMSRLTCDT